MSQYPSPYNPPPFPPNLGYSYPSGDFLFPARRAGTLMLVLGGLILLIGALNTAASLIVPADQLIQRQKTMLPNPPNADFQFSPAESKIMALIGGIATIITGAIFIIIALGVRRGGKASTIAAIVVTSLLLLLIGFMTLMFAIAGLAAPALLAISCITAFAFALLIWQLLWLIPALRSTARLPTAQQQYQMQYWQYQQNMQAHSGYGYGTPPTVPPSASENPPSPT